MIATQESFIRKGSEIPEKNRRKGYDVTSQQQIGHFALRTTTPENPFEPEPHDEQRFWFILEGKAVVTIEGEATEVEPGDLIVVAPWSKHTLRSDNEVRWVCFG